MRFTLMQSNRWLCAMAVCAALTGLAAGTAAAGDEDSDKTVETVEVKRAEQKGPKHPSLQFLKDHRVFIRARLDELRTQTTRVRSDDAELLDERLLRLKEMAAAIAAARDTVAAEYQATGERDTLSSVTQLAALEAQLDLIEQLLADQKRRLLMLEGDFLGHQETALVILVKGLSGKSHIPESIVLTEQNDVVHVALTPVQRTSLEQGGIAQIYHEFVEPREHLFEVGFTGDKWADAAPVAVKVEAARDRITFLELDLSRLQADLETSGLLTSVWYR
jgi:hypothetical protein